MEMQVFFRAFRVGWIVWTGGVAATALSSISSFLLVICNGSVVLNGFLGITVDPRYLQVYSSKTIVEEKITNAQDA
jgi:hypothetical protein